MYPLGLLCCRPVKRCQRGQRRFQLFMIAVIIVVIEGRRRLQGVVLSQNDGLQGAKVHGWCEGRRGRCVAHTCCCAVSIGGQSVVEVSTQLRLVHGQRRSHIQIETRASSARKMTLEIIQVVQLVLVGDRANRSGNELQN